MKGALFTAWAASVGLISWRAVAQQGRPPLPSEIVATMVVYGTLSLLGGGAETPAAVFGWGLVGASFLNLFTLPGTDQLKPGIAQAAKAGQPVTVAQGVRA